MLRLSRKVDVDASTRLISSIYLQTSEFDLMRAALSGRTIIKRRYRIRSSTEVVLAIDVFEGELSGLMLLEAEFPSIKAMREFEPPGYAGDEVTSDHQFTGGSLSARGLPQLNAKRNRV